MTSAHILRFCVGGLFLTVPLANTLTIDLGFPLTIAHCFVVLLAVVLLWRLRHGGAWRGSLPLILFAAFCATYVLAFVANIGTAPTGFDWAVGRNAPDVRSAVKVLWLLGNVVAAAVVMSAIRDARASQLAIRAFVIGAVLTSGYALYQVVGQSHGFFVALLPGTDFIEGTASFWIVPRAKSTFLEPSFFGAYAAAALPFAIVAFRSRWASVLSATLIVAGILVTFSIAGWLAAAVGAVAFVTLTLRQDRLPALVQIGAAVAAAVLVASILVPGLYRAAVALVDKGTIASGAVLVLPGSAQQPFPSARPGSDPPEAALISAAERVATTQAAVRMFASSPALGVGPGNFGFRYGEFRSAGTQQPTQLLIANNIYAELLAETGILGLVTYSVGFIGLGVLGLRARARATGFHARALAAGLAALAAIASAYLTGPSFTILYQWALFGLVAALIASRPDEVEAA